MTAPGDTQPARTGPHVPGAGVLYYAMGARYLGEARTSAQSVKAHAPGLPVAVISDQETLAGPGPGPFDICISAPVGPFSWGHRIDCLAMTPFERTLFLDTDTYVCSDIRPLLKILAVFHIAASHDAVRFSPSLDRSLGEYVSAGVPVAFPELNCGVLLYRSDERTRLFLRDWRATLEAQSGVFPYPYHDQPAFASALYHSDLRFAVLPPEYNCRFNSGGYLARRVVILHGRDPNLEEVAARLNTFTGPRVHWYTRGVLLVYPGSHPGRTALELARWGHLAALLRRALGNRTPSRPRPRGVAPAP